MIYQNDKNSLPIFKKAGCYYFSILKMCFDLFPGAGEFTMLKAIQFYQEQIADGQLDVREDMLIQDPQNLIDDLIGKGKLKFEGKFPVGFKPTEKEKVIDYWEFYRNGKLAGTHFTYGDYDPWYPASPWRLNGKLAGYRVFKVL